MLSVVYFQDISRRSQVRAANGVSVPAMVVFAHTLRYFRDHALRELSDAVGCRLLEHLYLHYVLQR